MGTDASYGPDPWGLPPLGGPSDDSDTAMETIRWVVVLLTHRGGYVGLWDRYDQDLHRSMQEHNLPIYHYWSNIGALSYKRGVNRGTGPKVVVITFWVGLGGTTRSGKVSGSRRDGDR